ncbi:ribonuclease D [Candidatus Methylacidiphilum fumarolicum]|uniref:Ribonuclease D n=2 Tax=Candidatus Methylacidiphilum fumarolicum TaxID=591154 RepID=I0K0H2_METFB|nr:ribonuclease D [Candidatus Methylacidiphilum fumarolicum]MBW6414576.1 ribonuclease D [Candidatus Methylacidiphilum fumarolicum]TFE65558.1 ribonuclease D [Candidatus Methylacidiphilum fumarolicum]TFE72645.1 ribonuclease D [Candidatus Methylacidiphilum fumarolicum]TFE75174.1 ribonuclease D [Candidatus Methylacidiphilum fumarolicum]TFE77419.1 ribonuclease D [Candidatus Methylacidiphilum fumarolicum]
MEQNKQLNLLSFSTTNRKVQWIEENNSLQEYLSILDPLKPIAIDIEGDSLHHYPEKLCVISLCQEGFLAVVDCLKGDLSSLWKMLSGCEWICHGMDYDLKMLRRAGCPQPQKIFDTHIAAKLCGFDSVGYADLVSLFFQVKLSKEHQKADWSRRPLPLSLVHYTAKDVLYLEKLKDILSKLLKSLGRSEWMEQSCERIRRKIEKSLSKPPYKDPERIEGFQKLDPFGQSILLEIQRWRQELALSKGIPPFKIIRTEDLIQISSISSQGESVLKIPAVKQLEKSIRYSLLQAIEKGKQNGPHKEPLVSKPFYFMDKESSKRFEELKNKRNKIASSLGLDPGLIASKALLSEMAMDPKTIRQRLIENDKLCPWQAELLGL